MGTSSTVIAVPWNKVLICGLSGHTGPRVALTVISGTGPRDETVDPRVGIVCKYARCVAGGRVSRGRPSGKRENAHNVD